MTFSRLPKPVAAAFLVALGPGLRAGQSLADPGSLRASHAITSSAAAGQPTTVTMPESYRLPAWFDRNRVQAHVGLGLNDLETEAFFGVHSALTNMGVGAFVRFVKPGDGPAWWPSKVGDVLQGAETRNLAREIVSNAHRHSLRVILYYRHMEDRQAGIEHPDWLCRDWRGRPMQKGRRSRGDLLCLSSPYRTFVLTRLLELVDMGADGFYFDSIHMPRSGCWCGHCRASFQEQTGLRHPLRPDPGDPVWQALVDFNNRVIEDTFLEWREAVHTAKREAVMLVSAASWPAMADRHLSGRLCAAADSVKTEFNLPWRHLRPKSQFALPPEFHPLEREVSLALGYRMARDASGGRPPHVWTHGLLNAASALYATAGLLTHGCIANLDVKGHTLPAERFDGAFRLGATVSPYLAGTVPLRWAAVHYPEEARGLRATRPLEVWREVQYPFYALFRTLFRARVPANVITDAQLESADTAGYRVLCVPDTTSLNPRMKSALRRFEMDGGVIFSDARKLADHLETAPSGDGGRSFVYPRVQGGPLGMHVGFFVEPVSHRLVVCLANDFSWVYTGRNPAPSDIRKGEPPPCRGARIVLPGANGASSALEALAQRGVEVRRVDGFCEVDVPAFRHMAVIIVERQRE